MKDDLVTRERALALLDYNPVTGVFVWTTKRGGATKSGDVAGTMQHGYRKITIDNAIVRAHRLAWLLTRGVWPSGQIDHIDGNKDNNAIGNLRDVPGRINVQNRLQTAPRKSGLPTGVTRQSKNTFGIILQTGGFRTPEEAHAAYLDAKEVFHDWKCRKVFTTTR